MDQNQQKGRGGVFAASAADDELRTQGHANGNGFDLSDFHGIDFEIIVHTARNDGLACTFPSINAGGPGVASAEDVGLAGPPFDQVGGTGTDYLFTGAADDMALCNQAFGNRGSDVFGEVELNKFERFAIEHMHAGGAQGGGRRLAINAALGKLSADVDDGPSTARAQGDITIG